MGVTDIVDVNANISSRINLMRIVLISGIVFVHVPYDPATSPYVGTYGGIDWLRIFLGGSLFRVGVPASAQFPVISYSVAVSKISTMAGR